VESYIFGVVPARKPLILVSLIVAEVISYIVIFYFSMISSSKLSLKVGKIRGNFPPEDPKFSPNNCLTNIFLHSVLQLSMLGS